MKNNKMRMGVFAGLMAAPVASVVTVSANGNVEADALSQIDVTQQAVNIEAITVAAVTPMTTAAISPSDWRLQELINLNESTYILGITRYETMLTELTALDGSFKAGTPLYDALTAKVQYIGEITDLKKRAVKLNNDIALLKPTNSDAIAATNTYAEQYKCLEKDFQEKRKALDKSITALLDAPPSTDEEKQIASAVDHLANYVGTLENFIKTQVPNHTLLEKFKVDIVEPQKFLSSTSSEPIEIVVGDKPVEIDFAAFIETTSDNIDPTIFVEQYTAIKVYLDTKLTADSKKIVESYILEDGRKVADLIKLAADEIAAANKVSALITAMDTTEFKSESTFASNVKAINTAYNKLSERAKVLVTEYAEKVQSSTDAQGKNTGYAAAEEAINAIKALKATSTQEYRDEVVAVRAIVDAVSEDYASFIINEPKLAQYEADLAKAKTVEDAINSLDDTATATTAQHIIDARAAYKALSAGEKKVVLKDTYKLLQDWEKTAKDSIKVNETITKIKIENKKTFATNVEKAQKQFTELGTAKKQSLVDARDRLMLLAPLAQIAGQYYSLKLGDTKEYRDGVADMYTKLNGNIETLTASTATYPKKAEDVELLKKLYDDLLSLVKPKVTQVDQAKAVEALINAAKAATGPAKLVAIAEARAAYDDLDKDPKKIVNNIKTLTEMEKVVSTPAKVEQQIIDVDPTATTFESKAKSAVSAYDKMTSSQKAFIDPKVKAMVADYIAMLEFIADMKAIKVSSPSYRDDVAEAKDRLAQLKGSVFTSEKAADLKEALAQYERQLVTIEQGVSKADLVVGLIDTLPSKTGEAFLDGVQLIEAEYNKLSSDDKKLVTNYKTFQTLKKDSEAAQKVVNLIYNTYIVNQDVANVNFEKAMKSAIAAYDKLTAAQRAYVYNYNSRIQPLLKIYELAVVINKIKPSSKTYREDINSARTRYEQLSNTEKEIAKPLLAKIEGNENGIDEVQKVMDLINEAVPGVENYTEKLKAAREAYDRLATLNAAYPKLVLNYKLLQEREKGLAPVTSSIYEIKELEILLSRPFNNAEEFVKKYAAAMKAYEKIPFESRQLITNRDVLLNVIYPAASTMEAIVNIKETSKTFGLDVLRAREMYDQLSPSDKALVTNYNKLVAFEVIVEGGSEVDELIRQIPLYSGTGYMQAIKNARAAYDQLTTSEKRAVSLYSQLQSYEKAVKNVMTAIDLIDGLQFASNLVTAYDKAQKAIDKLTSDQRQMVSNMNKLTAVAPAIEVFKQIEALKPGSEGYSGSVQAAYASYNRLSNVEKQYVTNFSKLQESKNNVDNLSVVIAKIKEIVPGSRNYGAQVQEALALYNALPSAVKKLVTNYDVLKTAENELAAVDKVRALIAEIDSEMPTFAQKVMAARAAYDKLTTTQKRLVSNYFMLEDYEKELGTMF